MCGFPWSLKVPNYTDTFKKSIDSNVNLGKTKDFLAYNEVSHIITAFDPDLLAKYTNSYKIEV